MAASSLPRVGMWQQGSELALWTKPSAQPLLHTAKVPSGPCSRVYSRLSPFLSR